MVERNQGEGEKDERAGKVCKRRKITRGKKAIGKREKKRKVREGEKKIE